MNKNQRVGYHQLRRKAMALGFVLTAGILTEESGEPSITVGTGDGIKKYKLAKEAYCTIYPDCPEYAELDKRQSSIYHLTDKLYPKFPGVWCIAEIETPQDFTNLINKAMDHRLQQASK